MIQCNFAPQSLPISNGVFEFDMTTQEGLLATPPLPAGAKSGVRGNIRFDPATTAPYSNEIALIQIVKLTDSGTGGNVDSGSMVPGRNVKTTEDTAGGVEGGFLTDVEHRRGTTDATPGSNLSAQYMINQLGVRDRGEFGFKRSNDPVDIKKATLFDFPGVRSTASNLDFEFETVAKGNDTMSVYGSLNWSFGIRAGDVVNEQVSAADGQSATFDEALELHRDFYVHEPVIFYFGFDQDTLQTAEIAKIDTFLDYLARFPDVQLSLAGFADRRGNPDYNLDLSLRRSQNVRQALIDRGIDETRINDILIGFGATEQHTSDDRAPNPGQDQDLEANRRGNRRVELTFEHTQSFPGP
jgi:outer membrane protein OmpA-like peptidoglycan-associated protein